MKNFLKFLVLFTALPCLAQAYGIFTPPNNVLSFDTAEITGTLPLENGGTEADLSATGGSNQFVKQSSAGAAFSVGTIADADVPNALTISGGTIDDTIIGSSTPDEGTFTSLSADDGTFTSLSAGSISATDVSATVFNGDLAGTADLANQLSANPVDCAPGQAPEGIDQNGDAEGCVDYVQAAEIDTSAKIAAIVTDETGSGALVFGTAPTLSNPVISGGTIDNSIIGGTTPATGTFTNFLVKNGSDTILNLQNTDPDVFSGDLVQMQMTQDLVANADAYRMFRQDLTVTGGTISAPTRIGHSQVLVNGSTISTGSGGNGPRSWHFATIWDSTGTAAEVFGIQTNAVVLDGGSSVAAGTVTSLIGNQVLLGFSSGATGSGTITNGYGFHIRTPQNRSAGVRQITTNVGLKIENQEATGITTGYAIQTGTGTVAFGDNVTVDSSALTTDYTFSSTNGNAFTTGGFLNFTSNSSDASTRNLFNMINDHASATGTTMVNLQQDSTNKIISMTRASVASTNDMVLFSDGGTSSGAAFTASKSGAGYGSNNGIGNILRTGNITGVNTETMIDFRVAPNFTLTEPGTGNFTYYGINSNLSGLAVTNAGGSSKVAAGYFNGSNDADINTSYSIETGPNGRVGFGNNLDFLNNNAVTNGVTQFGQDGGGDAFSNFKSGQNFKVYGNGTLELSLSATTADFQNNNITTTGSLTGASLTINGGTSITGHRSGTATNLTSASISAMVCGDYGTITVTGAAVGDTVYASPDGASSATGIEDSNLSWNSYVSSSNTVTIRACNMTALAIDAGDDQEWRADVWKH